MANTNQLSFVRNELTNILSQLNADNGKKQLLDLIDQGKNLSSAREALGQELNRTNVEGLATAVVAAAAAYNAANQITVPTVDDLMAGFDAAVAADAE